MSSGYDALVNFLKAQGGDSSGYTGTQGPQNVPPPSSVPSSPPPAPAAQGGQMGPQLTGIKGYLSNFLYGIAEQAKPALGLPTKAEQDQIDALGQQRMAAAQQTTQQITNSAQALQQHIDQQKNAQIGSVISSLPAGHPVKQQVAQLMGVPQAPQMPGAGSAVNENGSASSVPVATPSATPSGDISPADLIAYLQRQGQPDLSSLSTIARPTGSQAVLAPKKGPGLLRTILASGLSGMGNAEFALTGAPNPQQQQETAARTGLINAQTGLVNAQASQYGQMVTIQTPQGPVTGPLSQLKSSFPAMFAERGKETAATTMANSRIAVEGLKVLAEQGEYKQLVPSIDPSTSQPGYQMINKFGQSIGFVPGAIVKELLQRQSNTVQFLDTPSGVQILPKTTTTTPVLPGVTSGQVPSAPSQPQTGQIPQAKGPGETTQAYIQRVATPLPGESPQDTLSRIVSLASQQPARAPNAARPQVPAAAPGRGVVARPVLGANGQPLMGNQSTGNVIGIDAAGHQVLTDAGSATASGLTQVRKAGGAEAEKATNARNLLTVMDNSNPNDPGTLQLVDRLDKNGKLGVIASRWNEFLNGSLGKGDPDYEAFRVKMGLTNTGLMQVHVGARGNSALLEHFQGLVDNHKMDATALKSGIQTETNYVRTKAMLPQAAGGQQGQLSNYGFVAAH